MSRVTKKIGRIPISLGDWYEGMSVAKDLLVQHQNCTWQAVNDTTSEPSMDNPSFRLYAGIPVVQNVGDSAQSVMSQKAVSDTYGSFVENSEFVEATLDADGKIVEGIRIDGQKYLGKPSNQDEILHQQIDELSDYIENKTIQDEINIEELNEAIQDTNNRIDDNVESIGSINQSIEGVNERLNIVEEKTSELDHVGNSEFIDAVVDADGRVLEGTRADGQKFLARPSNQDELLQNQIDEISEVNQELNGALEQLGDTIGILSFGKVGNSEFIDAVVDADGKVLEGTLADGQKYLVRPSNQDEILQNQIDDINEVNQELNDTLGQLGDAVEALPFGEVKNSEFIDAVVDAEGKVLEGITTDAVKEVNVPCKFNGLTTFHDDIEFGEAGKTTIIDIIKNSGEEFVKNTSPYQAPHLPKYGKATIKSETFYLDYVEGVTSLDDLRLVQDVEDTVANANARMTISHYYYGNRKLRHFASGKVKLIDGNYYAQDTIRKINVTSNGVTTSKYFWADTLTGNSKKTNIVEDYSVEIPLSVYIAHQDELSALPNKGSLFISAESKEIPVMQLQGVPCLGAWTVEDWDHYNIVGTDIGKKFGHDCIVDVDFGNYLKLKNYKTEVKFQGNSTMAIRKRNLRFKFNKKQKIGEMLRTKSYNLKAAWSDYSKFNECFIFRMLNEVWQHRPITDRYPWDGKLNGYHHGVTGTIKSFPMAVYVGDKFYGIYTFGLKKDAKNYFLDDSDDTSGIFIAGAHNTSNDWGITLPYRINDPNDGSGTASGHYDEELDANGTGLTSEETQEAIMTWTHFINNRLYLGSDNNEYNSTQLSDVDGKMYLTSTLNRVFLGSDDNEYQRSELTHIGNNYYVTNTLEEGSPTDTTITANFSHYATKEGSISAKLIKFNRANMVERLDVLGFIDYFICMQVFVAYDNQHNNMIIYSGPDKKKFYPFFYDVDAALPYSNDVRTFDCDILGEGVSLSNDLSLWNNIKDLCWDEILIRYYELRDTVLNMDYIKQVYKNISDNIPDEDYARENARWNITTSDKLNFERRFEYLKNRLDWLDENYFVK